MKKTLASLLFILVVLPTAYFSLVAIAASENHDWKEMDWNGDGRVSIAEFLEGSDVGRRSVTSGDSECTEFFRYKDGMPIRVDCDG